ncbi:MAG: MFS transporter [Elusimicrobiota bacterium]|nr:MFS transporter [Elusimicrobiota bacterium]
MKPRKPLSEGAVLFLLASVHFANLVDFMMVMPLGPDFALALGIPMSDLGLIGGAYTASAFVVGVLGARFLDRWPRRQALVTSAAGLGLATVAGAFAWDAGSLIAARVAAGAFGGLAGTLCFSIVVDLVPDERRGKAMAVVSSGFSLSSIVGVPLGLELARRGGWRAPFVLVGGVILALAAACRFALPPLSAHLDSREREQPLALDEALYLSFAAFALAILGNFLLIPNLSAFLQFNAGFPREHLGYLYLAGGVASLASMRLAGVWTDRAGAFPAVTVASLVVAATLAAGVRQPPLIAPALFFAAFMGANAMRWVSIYSLASRLPPPGARGRFLSAQAALGHAFSGLGAWGSTRFLTADAAGRLYGMERLALAAAVMGLCVPLIVRRLEARVPRARA